jgi:hypothetical protein|tara:strand:- start:1608 stop:1715 length:108 start_codon:yes stop_codon:yes gene_type:complete
MPNEKPKSQGTKITIAFIFVIVPALVLAWAYLAQR